MMKRLIAVVCAAVLLGFTGHAQARYVAGEPPYLQREEVQSFISELVAEGFDEAQLRELFANARPQQRVIDLISAPAEARPWKTYRPIFITQQRINEGVAFWQEHEALILRASRAFQVNPEIIVSIIGVETSYGRNQGNFPVLDTLITLGFDYPPRANFFRSELAHFLRLVREEGIDLLATRGSYAGAMGRGQFISSSYRAYAVDFSGDGRRDLMNSWPDAIGSVANYFQRHGWAMGEPVALRADVDGERYKELLSRDYRARISLQTLAEHGVTPTRPVPEDAQFSIIELETESGFEVWLGYPNFYVITRYNRSPLYAMAVYELASLIRKERITQSAVGESQ